MGTVESWIGRGEALARLGVKTQTLYAYVSRGRITARPDPDNPRRSLYAVADIARLMGDPIPLANAAGPIDPGSREETEAVIPFRADHPAARGEAQVASSVGTIIEGRPVYRGRDAVRWAETATLEQTAALLWDTGGIDPFRGLKPRLALGGVTSRIRLFAALSRRAEEDAPSRGRDPDTLRREAASVLDEVIDAVAGSGPRLHYHQRLGRGWKVLERDNPLIRQALVLATDCGLDAAAVASRIAAGEGASPAASALAGLATLIGSPDMSALNRATTYVHEARRDPARLAVRYWTEGGSVPGFDPADPTPGGDPRARAMVAACEDRPDLVAVAREGEAVSCHPPTFGLGLALVARRLGLAREGAADLLLIGRLAGLLAHALDQITDGSPIVARLRYVGPRPGTH